MLQSSSDIPAMDSRYFFVARDFRRYVHEIIKIAFHSWRFLLPRSLCAVICSQIVAERWKYLWHFAKENILAAKNVFDRKISRKFPVQVSWTPATTFLLLDDRAAFLAEEFFALSSSNILPRMLIGPLRATERNELPLAVQTFAQCVWLYRRFFGFYRKRARVTFEERLC